jgi:hypothetical protein
MGDIIFRATIQSDLSSVVTYKKGIRQGDAVACLLFNAALGKTARHADVQTNNTVFYEPVQLLA